MAEQLESDEADTVVVENISPWLKFAVSATLFLTYMAYAMAWQAGDHYIRSLGFTTSETALLTNAITLAQVVGSLAAANVMLKHDYGQLPIRDEDDRLVSLVYDIDIIRALYE